MVPEHRGSAIYAHAVKRLRDLELEAEKLRQFLEVYRELSGDKAPSQPSNSGAKRRQVTTPEHQLRAHCIEILREAGRPMGWRALRDAMESRGVVVDGVSPRSRVITAMCRARPIVEHTDAGYVLVADAAEGARKPAPT